MFQLTVQQSLHQDSSHAERFGMDILHTEVHEPLFADQGNIRTLNIGNHNPENQGQGLGWAYQGNNRMEELNKSIPERTGR